MMKSRLPILGSLLLVAVSAAGSSDIADAYLAPANRVAYRLALPGGETRDFRAMNPQSPSEMTSADGWRLRFREGGRLARVKAPSKEGVGRQRLEFDRGQLVRCLDATGERTFAYGTPRNAPAEVLSPLAFYEFEEGYFQRQGDRQMEEKWKGSGRLRFPDVNPNRSGAFYAMLVLLGGVLLLRTDRRLKVVGGALTALAVPALLWTGSRGALLGLGAGLVPLAIAGRFAFLRRRWFWVMAGAALLVAVVWFGFLDSGSLTRGFTATGVDWGNAVRLDMWKTAPKMMFDAPGGWSAAGPGAGRAYFDWYQAFGELLLAGNLMNDHLTVLADVGWVGRGLYVFALGLLFLVSVAVLVRRRDGFPLAVWVALTVMAWFNPVYGVWTTWLVPCLAFGTLVAWAARSFRGVHLLWGVVIAVVCAVGGTGCLYAIGSTMPDAEVRVQADGPRVLVKTSKPSIWVVDDEQGALGAMFVGRDVREFYALHPEAPSIGYVRRLSALPSQGVRRLVLSGKAAMDWLLLLSENEEARRRLPREVMLISPPFAPSEIPEGVLKCCKTRVIVGEFAARFQPEYAKPPSYVTIVPSVERYVFGWMRFAVAE